MEALSQWMGSFAGLVWGLPLIILLTGAGIFFTILSRGVQWRALTHGIGILAGKYDDEKDHGELSHFRALCAALSATIGLGNISGVAVAIVLGGPGAVFWLWVVGLLGMATKFISCTLAVMYREKDEKGTYRGGPMWFIEKGMGRNWKWLALLFAFFGAISSFGIGNMYQVNEVANILNGTFGVPTIVTGVLFCILVGLVIIGGIRRIGAVAGKLVPAMVIVYVLGSLYIILSNASHVPGLLASIVHDAFTGSAASGAFIGVSIRTALQQGAKRAAFSNEAGLGSAPMAHAAARTNEPVREGLVAALGPFIDTVVICSMTALVILITDGHSRQPVATIETAQAPVEMTIDGESKIVVPLVLNATSEQEAAWMQEADDLFVRIEAADGSHEDISVRSLPAGNVAMARLTLANTPENLATANTLHDRFEAGQAVFLDRAGVALTVYSYDNGLNGFGRYFVGLAVVLFAFSTMISWSFYGESCTHYLLGQWAILPYRVVFVAVILIGALTKFGVVINFSDAMNGLMAVPNLIACLILAPRVASAAKDYFGRLDRGAFKE